MSLGTNNQHLRQLQEDKSTRWYSTLTTLESYEAISPALARMEADGVVSRGGSALLTASELIGIRSIITVLKIVRAASRQLEESKTPTIVRCAPTIAVML